jgi:pimeloyl-ACP methyl ester carboxylesterase
MSDTAWADRWFTSEDGLRLYYRDYQTPAPGRLPVICLPGLTRNSRDFESLALRLRGTRRVLSPDLRGRGRSQHDPNWQNYSPLTYVTDLARLFDSAGIGQMVLLGTSLGGILSMMICATSPGRVAGVILNDIGPEVAKEGLERISGYVGRHAPVSTWEQAAAQMRDAYGIALPDATDADWLAFARRSFTEVDGVPRLDLDPGVGEAVRAAPSGAAPDLWPLYGTLRAVPVLALRGELSDVLSEATFARMAAEKPDLVRVTVSRRGHPPLLDEPQSVDAIEAFLADLP